MTMSNKGLSKLTEEMGELNQVIGKKLACMETDTHWDDKGSLKVRMEHEMGDVVAAIQFVVEKLNLRAPAIVKRADLKLRRFKEWDKDETK